jgi:hypothetical protein
MLSISKYHNSTVIRYYNSCRRTIVFAIGSKDRDLDSSLADDRGLDSSYRSPKNLPKNLRRWPHPEELPLDLSAEFHIRAWAVSTHLENKWFSGAKSALISDFVPW